MARSERLVADAVAAGFAALAGNDAVLARSQFELALRIEPDNVSAQNGLERAASLPEVIAAMRRGDVHEQAGELEAAAAVYREVIAIDPDYAAARSALDTVNARIADARFASLITQGFAAIDERRFEEGTEHFAAALALRPDSESARDGLAQAEQGLAQSEIRMAEVRAMAFERTERWAEAIARYREALATDPTLAFAIEGLERAQQRADLDTKLSSLLDEPDTLLTDAGLRDGRLIFDQARAVAEPGPELSAQIERLGRLIELATTPIPVRLVSDNETEVTVYRVGPLGSFASHELELKPGRYTAVGQRRGYRDVRETFTVLPGADNGPITVVCAEPI
jgi:tetratricopeptide (TPR) repeat protein